MKISIIVPFHKGLQFLEDCLESISEQTYIEHIETILICDHIEENISHLLIKFGEIMDIKSANLAEATGVSAARNIGIELATGEYVYFLDSDDYLLPDTIEKLIQSKLDYSPDIIYGTIEKTWFKKKIFLDTFKIENRKNQRIYKACQNYGSTYYGDIESRLVEEDSDEDELDNDKADETEGDEANQNPDDNSQDQESGIDIYSTSHKLPSYYKYKSYLFRRRKVLKSITALNILIRKEFLLEHDILFDTNLFLYADVPFMTSVLYYTKTYACDLEAIYIKRNHNDEINFPSLDKMKHEGRFEQFATAYETSIENARDNIILKTSLEKKICNYYLKSFSKKLRRSKDVLWKTDKFMRMQGLVSAIDPSTIKCYKGIKRKLLKALIKGDVDRSIKHVNRNLAIKKLKKIVSSKSQLYRTINKHIFAKFSTKDNWVIFESFLGKNYSDSCKYIYLYLNENYGDQFKYIWILNDKSTKIEGNPCIVKRFSLRYFYYMTRSKYWVNNMRQPVWFPKREDQVLLETWHGTPLKKLVFDMEDVYSATPNYKAQVYSQSRKWDYLIAQNSFSTEVFQSCFMFEKEKILETGYPRNDIMHRDNSNEIADNIRKKLNLPINKKVILYAPTWRDDEYYDVGQYKFTLALDLYRLREEISDEYIILLRTHYFIADQLDISDLDGFAYNVSKYNDISELYLISDICITDYSSVFFDYAGLKRPILFFTYDLDKYRDVIRGFYINIETDVPGPLLYNNDDVIDAIKNIDKVKEKYADRYETFYNRFCSLDDGHATERVVNKVFFNK